MNREQFLRAVLERDASFDGRGIYGVTTTRVFCNPSCPARRPKPENIALFESVEAAQTAGFRACLRCKPQQFGLQLALGLGRDFERATRISQRQWEETARMTRFKNDARAGKSVIEAQNNAGFGSARALYQRARDHLGMTPASYGKGGQSARIRFASVPCELGQILVARTDVGVCSVMLGEDDASLETQLRAEFFAAHLERGADLESEIETVLASLRDQMPSPVLPLDVRATAFQARVWLELTRLKRGQTVSYGEMAARLGTPTSVRAVAAACGQNPVALVHPCHRVVGKSGALTGYRWGLERKRRLLEIEADLVREP